MDSLKIEIINPKAVKLLQNLADLNLITIKKNTSKNSFAAILKKLRAKSKSAPTLDEISKEVDVVRSRRNGR
ncbi:hypothetical protein [Pedobacter sp.]